MTAGRRPDVHILESKLYPAAGTDRPLPRPQLDASADLLDGAAAIALVVAPAGYGKSTLMTHWHAQLAARAVPCAWLSLDEDDDDPVRLLRHLAAALHKADAGIGASLEAPVGDYGGSAKVLLEPLANELARVRHRIVLFLDDLQALRQPQAIGIIDWFVNFGPRTMQFVLGSREQPPLRLARLRLQRQVLEVTARQLQFGPDDAALFFRSRLGAALPADALGRLLDKTEGWPAALELAALALADGGDPAALLAHISGESSREFSGRDPGIIEYLGEVVLSHLDEPMRRFVSCIAMFDRVDAALAAAASGAADARQRLDELRRRNLFVIPLDRNGDWLRLHHLVGEFFRERALRVAPAEAAACLMRGARWLHEQGHVEEAIHCAIRAGAWEQATPWVAGCVEELVLQRGYHQTILRWMDALPEAWVDRYPVIRIQYAFALAFYPRHQEWEAQVHRLRGQLSRLEGDSGADTHQIDELRCALELQSAMSLALRDDGLRGGEAAAAWLARWPQAPLPLKGVMGNVLAFGHKTAGRIAEGLTVLGQTRQWLQQGESFFSLAWTEFVEAVLHMKRGSYLEARRVCLEGLALVERRLNGHPAQAGLFHALLAGVLYEFDEVASAAEHLERATASVDDYGPADAVIVAYATRARLQWMRQDQPGALAALEAGRQVGQRRGLRRVVVTLAADECNALARVGRHEEARVVAARFGFDNLPALDEPSNLASDKAFRTASRYLLQRSPRLVAAALGRAIDDARERALAHRWVELLLLRALALRRDGDWPAAERDLQQALEVAAPQQYLRLFLDEAPDVGPMIEQLDLQRLRGSAAAPLARRLQQALRATGGAAEGAASVAHELTRREVAILKRLESGLSNKEIAEAIFISEGTLKWHLHNIYSKLDVKNRAGAMTRARALGIL